MTTIMVQMSDRQWTSQAMHLACAMARNTQSELVLLHLRQVVNPALLGTGRGMNLPTDSEYDDLHEYGMIAEDYGVALKVQPMEYVSLMEAIVQAAEELGASTVFAHLPERNFLPFWYRVQGWNMRRQLNARHCHLYTLQRPEKIAEWVPSVSLTATK